MTTSATTVFELSRNQIIAAAMRKCGLLAEGQTPSTEDYTNCQIALNGLIGYFQTIGMPLWKRTTLSVTLVASQVNYTIGIGQTIAEPFPVQVSQVRLVAASGGTIIDLQPKSVFDFDRLPTTSTGTPVAYKYQPKINLGILSIWPAATAATVSAYSLSVTYQKPIEGFTSASETPDFPQEWQLPMIYGLASLIAPEYGVPLEDQSSLTKTYDRYLSAIALNQTEDSSIFFQPNGQI